MPGIVGFGKAAELARQYMEADAKRLRVLRDKLENAFLKLEQVAVNGSTEYRLPHVSNLSFKYAESESMMMGFNKNLAVSSGSACTSAFVEPSYVLKAMGLSDDLAHASLRFALGRFTTEEEINFAIEQVRDTVIRLREEVQA